MIPGCPVPTLNKDATLESRPNNWWASVMTSWMGLAAPLVAMYSRNLKPEPEDIGANSGWVAHVASTASTTVIVDEGWLRTG
jgi:hypothetical protein